MGEIVFAAVVAAVACGMALGLGLSWAAGRRYDTWRKGHIKNFDEYKDLLLAKMRDEAKPEVKLPLPGDGCKAPVDFGDKAAAPGGVWNVSPDPEINSVLLGLPLSPGDGCKAPVDKPLDRSVYSGPCVSCGVPAPMETGGDHVVCPACSELASVIKAIAAADAVLHSSDYKCNCKPSGVECGRCGGRKQRWQVICAGCWAELVGRELDRGPV